MLPSLRRVLPLTSAVLIASTLLIAVGSVRASGGPTPVAAADRNQIIGQSHYRCRGGIRVQVTQMQGTARVDFAGRSQTLQLAPEGSGVAYQNNDFAWFSQGKTSYMKSMHSGNLTLTDCVAVGN
jgi:membrane-bound inhibitor of C-type lysozyme